MKFNYLLIGLLFLTFFSCNRNDQETPEPSDFGYLSMNISISITEEPANGRVEAVPTDDWQVTIFNASDDSEAMVFDPYSTAPSEVQLPTGEYYIEAHSNNFAEAAFENPYYFGRSVNFTIDKEELKTIDIDAEMANSKVAINYSPNVTSTFDSYSGTVSVVRSGASLVYNETETREGYFVSEPLAVVVDLSYTKLDGSFITRQFTANIDAQPKTLYNVNVDATLEDGKITMNINVDESFNEEVIELGDASPKIILDDNGVTIKASPDAVVGDSEVINGITYTVVSEQQLRSMVSNDEDVSTVCTSLITDMNSLFLFKTSFNQDISSWDVSNVSNMRNMFKDAYSFNQNIGLWDVSSVNNMSSMFVACYPFNQDIGSWNVSNVTDMTSMFLLAQGFNQNISSWDVSNVQTMGDMFREAISFNQNVGPWDVSSVTNMRGMFWNATSFNQNLSSWNVTNVINCTDFKSAKLWTGPTFTNCTP